MDVSGMMHYHVGISPVSAASTTRGIMTPHVEMGMSSYQPAGMGNVMSFAPNGYGYGPAATMPHYQQMSSGYHGGYVTPNPPRALSTVNVLPPDMSNVREARNSYPQGGGRPSMGKVDERSTYQPPPVPYEPSEPPPAPEPKMESPVPLATEPSFSTTVDTLMKEIQAKTKKTPSRSSSTAVEPNVASSAPKNPYGQEYPQGYSTSPNTHVPAVPSREPQESPSPSPKSKKRYECDIAGCGKDFSQKTHLEIHMRAHTGVKPFPCREPGCGQRFSQLGNLKTHERRHTGERPYHCETCGKRFAQRGNVRAHRIVHEQHKPYICKLDDCRKQFTQLGNLKSHQNKFHAASLKQLTQKFATMREGDPVTPADKELWEYFATLYKNSNKGIKGRGKDRKIVGTSRRSFKSDSSGGHVFSRGSSQKSASPSSVHSHSSSSVHGVGHEGYDFGTAAAELELDDGNSVEVTSAAASTTSYAAHHPQNSIHGYSGEHHTPTDAYGFGDRKLYQQ